MVGTRCFHCRGPRFSGWSGNEDPISQAVQQQKKKKKSHLFKVWKVTVPTIILLVSHLDDCASPLSPLHSLHTPVNLTVPSGDHTALKHPGGPRFLPQLVHPLQTVGFVSVSGLFSLFLLPILLSGQIPHCLEIALSFPMTMRITETPSANNSIMSSPFDRILPIPPAPNKAHF